MPNFNINPSSPVIVRSPGKTVVVLWFKIILLNILTGAIAHHLVLPYLDKHYGITWNPAIVSHLIELYLTGSGLSIMFYYQVIRPLKKYSSELLELSTLDALTGLYNRRYLLSFLEREMNLIYRHAGDSYNCALLMVDIDNFKAINDNHGHEYGDEVLLSVAKLLKEHTRSYSISARYGGDEFIMVVPKANLVAVEGLLKRFSESAKALLPTTLSIGAALLPSEGVLTPDQWIALADKALYESKNSGKHKYTIL
jgi:diguanylate cyclase (GGDEF)-like protein